MPEISLKNVCCTCLSTKRILQQLYRVTDGVNLLYMLLTHDPDAYKEGFYKDTASLRVCWECSAILKRIKRFQLQACAIQKQLTAIADGQDVKVKSVSRLTTVKITKPNHEYQHDNTTEIFIDCGIKVPEIKVESDDDMPLSSYHLGNNLNDKYIDIENDFRVSNVTEVEKVAINNFSDNGLDIGNDFDHNYSAIDKTVIDNNSHGNTVRENCKVTGNIEEVNRKKTGRINSKNGNTDIENAIENTGNTIKKKTRTLKIKKVKDSSLNLKYKKYIKIKLMTEEEIQQYLNAQKRLSESNVQWKCISCVLEFKSEKEMINHNKKFHEKSYQNKSGTVMDDLKYPCPKCDESFRNKDIRWRHIQKIHKEGYKCKTCGKKFSLKANMERHESTHAINITRVPCKVCHKMVRPQCALIHSQIHKNRRTHTCVQCNNTYVTKYTYENHLKYSHKHGAGNNFKVKCELCNKGYITKRELEDHINYVHKGQALHKCPTCGKGLATARCLKRHIRRAHEGFKENVRDYICQQCGKSFKIKKCLYEHELIHTGARPLSCTICGRAFRQKAALYTHTRRVHKVTNS